MTKATGPLYRVKFRRRREGRTDYEKRYRLLKSGKPRLVVRKTNRRVIAHVTQATDKGDAVLAHATSTDLAAFGFAGKCNAPSAYLTGLLVGKRAAQKGVREAVLDIGLHKASKGSVVFAAAKGAVDGGLAANVGDGVLPSAERLAGAHLNGGAKGFEDAKKKILEG